MTDEEIRQLVRDAIARHLGGETKGTPAAAEGQPPSARPVPIAFARYHLPRAPEDTMCIIEPAVLCNGCGYCQLHGH